MIAIDSEVNPNHPDRNPPGVSRTRQTFMVSALAS